MKTEREIRAHRDDLREAACFPCGCARAGHAEECKRGRLMMVVAAHALSWALGEVPDYDRVVEEVARAVRS